MGEASDALGGGDGFAVGKNAPPEAIEFVRFLTSVETQTAMAKAGFAVPPTVKGAEAAIEDPLIKEVQQRAGAATYYQLYYDQYLPPAVGQAINDATQELFAGTQLARARSPRRSRTRRRLSLSLRSDSSLVMSNE